MGLDTLGRSSTISAKEDNFCNFLFPLLHTKPLTKMGLLRKNLLPLECERPTFRLKKFKGTGYTCSSFISTKGDNFCDFLFPLLQIKPLLKNALLGKNLLPLVLSFIYSFLFDTSNCSNPVSFVCLSSSLSKFFSYFIPSNSSLFGRLGLYCAVSCCSFTWRYRQRNLQKNNTNIITSDTRIYQENIFLISPQKHLVGTH